MSVIRVNLLNEFYYGDDAVLLTMDGAGVDLLRTALCDPAAQGSSRFVHDGVTHEFRIDPSAAALELEETHVVWRLDHAKAVEIINDLAVLSDKGRDGHQYVDISTPAQTLIVSRDEYVDVVYPWLSPS